MAKLLPLIGLTGGMGTGKSAVAKVFERAHIPVVDADQIARSLRAPGEPGHDLLLKNFGTTDRTQLREMLSKDPAKKALLESLLHPLIRERSEARFLELSLLHPSVPFILYEASLLIEAGRVEDVEKLIVVTSPLDARIARIRDRDQVSEEQAKQMILAQSSDDFRLLHADFVIRNVGSLQDLEQKTTKLLDQIISP